MDKKKDNPIGFYYLDKEYASYLRNPCVGDQHIPNTDYAGHQKFFLGTVLSINDKEYLAPVSSYKEVNDWTFNIKDTLNLGYHKVEKVIASVRLNFMLPVIDGVYQAVDFKNFPNDSYQKYVEKEYRYCKQHRSEIKELAQEIYNLRCSGRTHVGDGMHLNNFPKLERAAEKYAFKLKIRAERAAQEKLSRFKLTGSSSTKQQSEIGCNQGQG